MQSAVPEATPILNASTSHRSSYGITDSIGSLGASGSSVTNQEPAATHRRTNTEAASNVASSSRSVASLATNAANPSPVEQQQQRLRSLDVFRGITILLMIFVNYGGGKYYFFRHSPWNGLTVADLLFPWFMWIMGVSMVYSLRSQLRKGIPRSSIIIKIIKRSIILFALGLLFNGITNRNTPTLRIPGVLQRFSFCYLFTATMEVLLMTVNSGESLEGGSWLGGGWYMFRDVVDAWLQWSFVIVIVSLHTLVTYVVMVPGCPRGYIGPGGLHDYSADVNCTGGVAAYIDRMFFTSQHIYQHSTATKIYQNVTHHDPEGILGVMTSILMVQFGVAVGRILISHEGHKDRVLRFLAWSVSCGLFAGVLCGFSKEYGVVPVNKNLWSLSYVLTTASFASILFSIIYIAVDWSGKWNGNPARYAGLNSILLYVGHELTGDVFPFSWTPVGNTHGAYLLMHLWGASLWGLIAYVCHKKKIYISV